MQPAEGFEQEAENMGQDTHRSGRHRRCGRNWNWDFEGGRSGGMEECKFARKDRERIMTQCSVRGKGLIVLTEQRRPEVSDGSLSFSPQRSSFHLLIHQLLHPSLFSCTTCGWTSSTLCSSSLELTSVINFLRRLHHFSRQCGKRDGIPHGIVQARWSIFISR